MIKISLSSCRLTALIGAALLVLAGCHSEHLGPNYGVRTRAFFAKQRVHPTAARDNPSGLDSEESALIHASYRKNMGGKGTAEPKESPSRVLIVEENKESEKK
jgi:hypothetical protein